ncbi:DUF6284 family protein [Micromonospora sp. NPDC004704]
MGHTSHAQLGAEPSPAELAEIERELPLIAAEVELLDAEITVLSAEPLPTELDWRRVRRAARRVEREAVVFYGRPVPAASPVGRAA